MKKKKNQQEARRSLRNENKEAKLKKKNVFPISGFVSQSHRGSFPVTLRSMQVQIFTVQYTLLTRRTKNHVAFSGHVGNIYMDILKP